MIFKIDDYVIRKAAPEFIWRVVDTALTSRHGISPFEGDNLLTLAPVCTIDGKPPLSNIKQQSWSWTCEPANAMLVIAYEASHA